MDELVVEKMSFRVNGLIKKYKFSTIMDSRYIEISSMGNLLVKSFKLNSICYDIELKKSVMHDGVACFYTNSNSVEADAAKVIKYYRDKNKVEESFHEIKSHIRIHPVFVS